jgi:hypothetical protein
MIIKKWVHVFSEETDVYTVMNESGSGFIRFM